MRFPFCPECEEPSTIDDARVRPQTWEQYERNADNYVCRNGHRFEGKVPLKLSTDGYGLRDDM